MIQKKYPVCPRLRYNKDSVVIGVVSRARIQELAAKSSEPAPVDSYTKQQRIAVGGQVTT